MFYRHYKDRAQHSFPYGPDYTVPQWRQLPPHGYYISYKISPPLKTVLRSLLYHSLNKL